MTTLSARLRELRETGFDGRPVLQRDLAEALAVGITAISTWEKGGPGRPFPGRRVMDYALFFATPRSLAGRPRLLSVEDLDPEERERMVALYQELTALRSRNSAQFLDTRPATDILRFPPGERIRVLCGTLPVPPRQANPVDHNHAWYSGIADLDALVELSGHLHRVNPDSDVRIVEARRAADDDPSMHLVMLGSQASAEILATGRFGLTQVPARGPTGHVLDGEVFETRSGTRFTPEFEDPADWRSPVVSDVGLIARTPNRRAGRGTVTLLSGVFTRGSLGAVRALTDVDLRAENARHLEDRFAGADTWAVLFRVELAGGAVRTPHLGVGDAVLFTRP